MTSRETLSDITPVAEADCFLVVQRPNPGFNYPLHVHREFELGYLEHAAGVFRQVGNTIEEIEEEDLVLIAGGIQHTYININPNASKEKTILQITIHFHQSLFDSLIHKRHFKSIRRMFENAANGLVFSPQMIQQTRESLKSLSNDEHPDSFHNLLKLIEMLKILSLDTKARRLTNKDALTNNKEIEVDRLDEVLRYLHKNHCKPISITQVATALNTSEASLNRFLKQWTGKTYIDHLNDIRIADAVCRLIETSDSVAEICYKCGFNNLSNFNRIFKKRKGCTPTRYRKKYAHQRFRL